MEQSIKSAFRNLFQVIEDSHANPTDKERLKLAAQNAYRSVGGYENPQTEQLFTN